MDRVSFQSKHGAGKTFSNHFNAKNLHGKETAKSATALYGCTDVIEEKVFYTVLFTCLLLQSCDDEISFRPPCSCHRSQRNSGWWELVWASYDEGRF